MSKPTKKTYEKPAIVYRQTLESVASVCDSGSGGKGDPSCSTVNS